MKLNEAIEQLKKLELPYKSEQDHKKHISVRLGIEALERIGAIRKGLIYNEMSAGDKLPSEADKKQ